MFSILLINHNNAEKHICYDVRAEGLTEIPILNKNQLDSYDNIGINLTVPTFIEINNSSKVLYNVAKKVCVEKYGFDNKTVELVIGDGEISVFKDKILTLTFYIAPITFHDPVIENVFAEDQFEGIFNDSEVQNNPPRVLRGSI